MEFTIQRDELLAGLYLTQGIVERRTTIPILSNVLIQSTSNGVAVVATDQEVTVRRQCEAAIKQKGMLTTPARKLYEMMREFPAGEIKIRSLETGWIEVANARAKFRLVGLDPKEFPVSKDLDHKGKGSVLKLSSTILAEMIERTLFAVSSDETRANLHGIFFEGVGPGLLRMVATDGHRLSLMTRSVEGSAPEKGVVIPRKAIVELRKVIEGDEDTVHLGIDAGMAHIERGVVQMSMRLIEGEFPDYRQVVPAKSEKLATVAVGTLLSALRRVAVVSSERTRGVKMQIDSNKIEISSINPEVGEGSEEIEVEYEADPVSIGFNARYLIDALSLLAADEKLEIGLNDDVSPGQFRLVSDPDYCYIVMPMRL
jgi:DNA polymerase-3 subunit beta